MKNKRILAIDPGTRFLGYALLEDHDLIHFGVKTIPYTKEKRKMVSMGRKIILRLIADYRPEILIVEKTFFGGIKGSVWLNIFVRLIQCLGKQQGLQVLSIAANSVRKVVCRNGSASKEEVAQAIVLRFPELKPYLFSERRWQAKFHFNLFDAVALAVVAQDNLK